MGKIISLNIFILITMVSAAYADSACNNMMININRNELNSAYELIDACLSEKNSYVDEMRSDLERAGKLSAIAHLYTIRGEYSSSSEALEEAISIYKNYEQQIGPFSPLYSARGLYHYLTRAYYNSGNLKKAYEANEILLKARQEGHEVFNLSFVAPIIHGARIKAELGEYRESEHALRQLLKNIKQHYGDEGLTYAQTLNALSDLYLNIGRLDEHSKILFESFHIFEGILSKGWDSSVNASLSNPLYKNTFYQHYASVLGNLGSLYLKRNDYANAEKYLRKSIEIISSMIALNDPYITQPMLMLADVYIQEGKYSEAEEQIFSAQKLIHNRVGDDHPFFHSSNRTLAKLHIAKKEYREALKLLSNYHDTWSFKQSVGLDPKFIRVFQDIAMCYVNTNQFSLAEDTYRKWFDSSEQLKQILYSSSNTSEKIKYQNMQREIFDKYISYVVITHKERPENLKTLLSWLSSTNKSIIESDFIANSMLRSSTSEIKQIYEELIKTRQSLTQLFFSPPKEISQERIKEQIIDLINKRDDLNEQLLSKGAPKKLTALNASEIEGYFEELSKKDVYICFVKYDHFDFSANATSEEKYIALILTTDKENSIRLVELGKASTIDKIINRLHSTINESTAIGKYPNNDIIKNLTKHLYPILWKPIVETLTNKSNIYLSTDGDLSILPFELFYNIDTKLDDNQPNLIYVQDINHKYASNCSRNKRVVIISDPDFDYTNISEEKKQNNKCTLFRNYSNDSINELHFNKLPDTRIEGISISNVFKDRLEFSISSFSGKEATEDALFQNQRANIIHIATHGFFLNLENGKKTPLNSQAVPAFEKQLVPEPMLLTGLALAGANHSIKHGGEEGILTSEKLLGFDASETDLIVLSACNTGNGTINDGDGIYGLQRSFFLAGAKSLIVSLWNVPSKETAELMAIFYKHVADGYNYASSLKLAKREMSNKGFPFFCWGGFILTNASLSHQ